MIKTIIFDMDGVLIDSEIVYASMCKDFLINELKVPLEPQIIEQAIYTYVGRPDKDLYRWLVSNLPNNYTLEYIEEKSYEYMEKNFHLNYHDILNPHVAMILPLLKQYGFSLAIASSSPFENIKKVMADCGIEEYFDVVMSGNQVKESKPNPEIYVKTLEKLHANKEEVIAIEDSTYGISAAINAGLKVIALEDTRFGFDQSKATYLVKDLLQAYQLIMKI